MTETQEAVAAVEEESKQARSKYFVERGVLRGHNRAITALTVSPKGLLVSASRDSTALVWSLLRRQDNWATEYTRLCGHNHFVSGIALSGDASHLLTSSWDKTIRLWDLDARSTKKCMKGHTADVLAVTFSPSNKHIISCSRDKTVRLWNINGECKVKQDVPAWPTCVACLEDTKINALTVAVGLWDGKVRVISFGSEASVKYTLAGHEGRVTSVCFSPDDQFVITGGSDNKVILWRLDDGSKAMTFTTTSPVNAVACRPTEAWLCAATYSGVWVWDIQEQHQIDQVSPNFEAKGKKERGRLPDCTAVAWSEDGTDMYTGYNNGEIYAWSVASQ